MAQALVSCIIDDCYVVGHYDQIVYWPLDDEVNKY